MYSKNKALKLLQVPAKADSARHASMWVRKQVRLERLSASTEDVLHSILRAKIIERL